MSVDREKRAGRVHGGGGSECSGPPKLSLFGAGALPSATASELMASAAKLARMGAWEYDFKRHEVFWTDGVFDIFDLESERPPVYDEAIEYYLEEDRGKLRAALDAAMDERRDGDLTCRVISAKGVRKFVRVIIHPVVEAEGVAVTRLCGVVQDVTDTHLLQRGMQRFYEMTPDLVAAFDYGGKAVSVSPSWQRVLGIGERDLVRGGFLDCVHPADREKMRLLMEAASKVGVVHHVENRLRDIHGEFRWFSWRVFGDDEAKMIFVSARDITNRKEAEAALMEAKRQAEAANGAKSDFLAVMSHELRTPLNPILGFTDLLMEETRDPEHRQILASISEAGQNLTKVIGDVLDFAKIESGRVELVEEPFELRKLFERKLELMRRQIAKGVPVELKHAIEIDESFGQGARFVADNEKIARVLANLLDNAIKFTKAGLIEVRAKVAPSDQAVVLEVEVSDTGPGIPAESLEEIFEPFRQLDSSRTRSHGGSGLGLSICKKLVELMGGELGVRSRRGEGSRFSFTIPLRRASRKAPSRSKGFDLGAWPKRWKAGTRPVSCWSRTTPPIPSTQRRF